MILHTSSLLSALSCILLTPCLAFLLLRIACMGRGPFVIFEPGRISVTFRRRLFSSLELLRRLNPTGPSDALGGEVDWVLGPGLGFWTCGLGEQLGPAQGGEPDKLLVETRLRLLIVPSAGGLCLGFSLSLSGKSDVLVLGATEICQRGREIGSGAPVGAACSVIIPEGI